MYLPNNGRNFRSRTMNGMGTGRNQASSPSLSSASSPVIPLPNPGEGGPVSPLPDASTPVVPLPNPGEGGPVAPLPDASTPVIPLPNPGEGGPVDPFPDASTPVIPLPNPGEGGPVDPLPDASTPVVPLPNPGEGGPVWPNYPIVNRPSLCFHCTFPRSGMVRFLNTVSGYEPFRISLGNTQVSDQFPYGSMTAYGRVAPGYQMVTVSGQNGYIYLQKTLPFRADSRSTVAIVKTASGMDLMQISDDICPYQGAMACLRLCNLDYYSNPLDLLTSGGRVAASNVQYREVTPFKRIRPGEYQFYLAETGQYITPYQGQLDPIESTAAISTLSGMLLSFYLTVRAGVSYSIFVLGRGESEPMELLVAEDT